MKRLTKTYEDGTHAAADDLPCGENSWDYKKLLLEHLGVYEDIGMEPEEIILFKRDYEKYTCTGCWLKMKKELQ